MTTAVPPPAPVVLSEGRVRTEAVEINVARHCNISCRSCSHGSPSMRPWFADPVRVEQDLASLAQWMRVDHVRVLGGEPLLHPQLIDVLQAIRRSGIGSRRRLITNGLQLALQAEHFWDEVEEVHVSVYPNTARHVAAARPAILRAAANSGTRLRFKHFGHFRLPFRRPDDHPELTQDVYATCQIANRWRCITVDEGWIHRCPQAMLAADGDAAAEDGLTITEIDAAATLRSWLLRAEALRSCRGCAGSVGVRHPHRARIRTDAEVPDNALDLGFLARLRTDPNADNGCVSVDEQC